MGSPGSENAESFSGNGNSDADYADTQPLEFDSQFSPFSGEEIDNSLYELQCWENAQPRDDTALTNCAFETQRMDFDSEAQPFNVTEETQVMDLAEEMQMLDNAGGSGCLETQLCEFDDEEAAELCGDDEDAVGTKVLTDVEGLADGDSFTRSSDKALGSKGIHPTSGLKLEAKSNQVGSTHSADGNATCSSGSVKQGFTSIRAASFRTSGLSARKKMNAKGLEPGDVSNPGEVKSNEMCDGAVNQESVVGEIIEGLEELNHESNTNGCSMANRLGLENSDTDEHEHRDNTDNVGGESFGQVRVCTDDLAGLSYVNSQEPGESTQANALDFVDQFLKSSDCVFDLGTKQRDVGYRKLSPGVSSTKGAQKLAKKVNTSCALAETGVYNWDVSNEDEGGGEFLRRNKEVLYSNLSGNRKSLTEPQKPKNSGQIKRRTHQKALNKEHQSRIGRNKFKGLAHSESGLTAGRNVDRLEKMNINRNLDSSFKEQICASSTDIQLDPVGDDEEIRGSYDIGVDTQMAVEAIEALSNGVALPTDGETALRGEGSGGQLKDKMAHDIAVKQNSTQRRVHLSNQGVATRSKQSNKITDEVGDKSKLSVTSHTRSKNVRKKVITRKGSKRRQSSEKITDLNENVVQDERNFKVKEKVNKGTRERSLDNDESSPAKKQRLEEKISFCSPVSSRTRRKRVATVNAASELSVDCQTRAKMSRLVDADGSGSKKNKCVLNAKDKDLKHTTTRDGFHTDGLACSGGNTDAPLIGNGKSKVSLEESARYAEGQSITRQKRSSRKKLSSKQFQPSLSSNENKGCSSSAQKVQPKCLTQGTPKETKKTPRSACVTPVQSRTSINTASPVCMGDEYYKITCKKNLERSSLMKELNSLTSSGLRYSLSDKVLRKRRDMASIRVLFSHRLGEDTIEHQKKILARLGVSAVSSMVDATHFVADEFVRTRNMLEAIAHSKPVVNHLWLESCGEAGCYIDERNYILRDAKKEKELGFSLQVSLSRASQHPLLEGRRVLITPNTKPGVQVLSNLVKAVHGQAFEKICRSIYTGDKLREDLLILSCEEDYEFCMPLLEKGAEVYSSELLLNGIIVQKLEYGRHRLFYDNVKRTRSTIWLKKDGNEFHPVSRHL